MCCACLKETVFKWDNDNPFFELRKEKVKETCTLFKKIKSKKKAF